MRLLAALEVLTSLPDPFLPFQDEIGELIGQFLGEKFQQTESKNEIDLNILIILGLSQRALQEVRQQLAERRIVQALDVAQLNTGKIRRASALANQVK